jgi:hypothetical protein
MLATSLTVQYVPLIEGEAPDDDDASDHPN